MDCVFFGLVGYSKSFTFTLHTFIHSYSSFTHTHTLMEQPSEAIWGSPKDWKINLWRSFIFCLNTPLEKTGQCGVNQMLPWLFLKDMVIFSTISAANNKVLIKMDFLLNKMDAWLEIQHSFISAVWMFNDWMVVTVRNRLRPRVLTSDS